MNPVESPSAVLRLRSSAARCYKKVTSAEASICKTLPIAETKSRRLNAPELLEEVSKGKPFLDAAAVNEIDRKLAA